MLWIGLLLFALGLLLGGAVLRQIWRDHREALEAERRWRAQCAARWGMGTNTNSPRVRMTGLSYRHWHGEAERRGKAGERQSVCLACGRWRWWDECETCEEAKGTGEGRTRG